MARRRQSSRRPAVRARRNFAFLLPFLPLAVPVVVAGGLIYAGKQWISGTSKTAKLVLSPIPVVGGSAGYIAARATHQDKQVQIAAALGGYFAGLIINRFVNASSPEVKAAASQTVADLMATGLTKEEAEARIKASLEDAKWCADHPTPANFAPSCVFSG